MRMERFRTVARDGAAKAGNPNLATVIEKEIVHYDVLAALSECEANVTFQGGTCLRLCYGSPRYSEDLDFSCDDIGSLDIRLITRTLETRLQDRFDTMVRVRSPKTKAFTEHTSIRRWMVVIDTSPERPDIPMQRIKVEVADVPHHTFEPHHLEVRYAEVPASYGDITIACQSVEEILADKVVSFANTEGYVRYRDLWDIPWICGTHDIDYGLTSELARMKVRDYHCPHTFEELVARGVARSTEEAVARDFSSQISRFLDGRSNARLGDPTDTLSVVTGVYEGMLGPSETDELARCARELQEKRISRCC